jgi:hypothetical protein
MDKCEIRAHLDNIDGRPYFVCSICECPLGAHCFYVHCPLLDDELICIDCCQSDVEKDEIIETLEELGKSYTREEIEKICKGCGNRSCGMRLPEEST